MTEISFHNFLCGLSFQVALCESQLTDIGKAECASQPRAAVASSCTPASLCSFSYSWTSTPTIASLSPSAGQGGSRITILGKYLSDILAVRYK